MVHTAAARGMRMPSVRHQVFGIAKGHDKAGQKIEKASLLKFRIFQKFIKFQESKLRQNYVALPIASLALMFFESSSFSGSASFHSRT